MAPETKRRRPDDAGRTEPPSKRPTTAPPARNAYTAMFEEFRNHMDAQQERRERVVKASRDITALSKKMIFALQRVQSIGPDLPQDVGKEVHGRLAEISRLLVAVAPELQGIDRGRYGRVLFGMEELVEALTFRHYLQTQSLLGFEDACAEVARLCHAGHDAEAATAGAAADPASPALTPAAAEPAARPTVVPNENDYLMGVFDLSGEMMRFATTTAALRGKLAGRDDDGDDGDHDGGGARTIVGDMQALGGFLEMLPQRQDKSWRTKLQVLRTSVQKVERLGYDLRVRGSERPKGWLPDTEAEAASPE